MSTNTVNLILVLDRSGSMESMGKEPVQSMNNFIKKQQMDQKGNSNMNITLYTFANDIKCVFKNVPLRECKEFTEYFPNGGTALYDCLKQAIDEAGITTTVTTTVTTNVTTTTTTSVTTQADKNILVIITDGQDNASKVSASEIKTKMTELRDKHNWQIVFLAKGEDAFTESGNVGCVNNVKLGSSRGNMARAMESLSMGITNYCSGKSATVDVQTP